MQISDNLTTLGNSARPRILVITLRRLGDVLLTTPLIRSLRRHWPNAQIDTLVFAGTQGILAGNPDLNHILTLAEKASPLATLRLMTKLWRRYDLAISTQTGDRPTLFAFLAGRRRIGLVKPDDSAGWIKRHLLDVRVPADLTVHRVTETLRLVEAAGAAPDARLVPPQEAKPGGTPVAPPAGRYAVLHPNPKYPLRRWTKAGWHGLAAAMQARGLAVVVTGGPDPDEKRYLDDLWAGCATPIDRRDGKLGWPQLAALIAKAAVYVGPDTSMTHLAASTGCPTVGLYGPASPVIIGPWPVGGFPGGLPGSWQPSGTVQHRGNVWLVQNPAACPFGIFPCEKLGCDGHLNSRSQCLDELTAEQVLSAVDAALAGSNNQAATSGAT